MRALVRTVLVAGLGVALVLGAYRLPDLRFHLAGSASAGGSAAGSVTPATRPVTRSTLICPGPASVGVKGVDAATAAAPTTVRAAAPPADLLGDLLRDVTSGAAGSVAATAVGGSGPVTFPPFTTPGANGLQTNVARSILFTGKGSLAPGLVAEQTTLIPTGDQRGLSTSACAAPAADTWLVGGGGEPGRRGRIVLTNPSPNGVTVDLEVYGAKGPVRATAARGIVVGAHERTVVLLDAIAPGERSPVVHVVASGGVISASLSDTWLDGTTPVGADDVVGTAPGTRLVVPGVVASGAPGSLVLRIGATSHEAVVRVRLLGAQGPTVAPVNNGVIRVPARRVKDVDLSRVAAGGYGIQLTSDQPVVAAAELRPPAASATALRDLSWTSAQPAVSVLAGVPLGLIGPTWTSSLMLTAPDADARVDVVTVAPDGSQTVRPVSVEAGTSVSVPLAAPALSAWLRPRAGSVTAALVTTYADPAGPMTSVAPLADTPLRTSPVTVHPLGG
jgi:Family of unknown function (DUF5719)